MINGLATYKKKWNIQTDAAIKPGLEAITAVLKELNNPHQHGTFIHIAGTNGKGSTAAFLASILREHGLTIGNFFSPEIEDLHDQIQINGKPVSEEEMDRAMNRLATIRTPLTDFELLTAAAFLIFDMHPLDVIIIEAGLGGRFDSTNVIDPAVSIIPSLSMEHTAFLGDTLEEIAWHKAGIIKKWKPVVAGNLPEPAMAVVKEWADKLHSEVIQSKEPITVELNLKGPHQIRNAQLAIEAAKEILLLTFDQEKTDAGLSKATIPFRFEELYPGLILDAAHNAESIEALIQTVKEQFPTKEIHFVVGILKDKNYKEILRKLETISDHFTFIAFESDRALEANTLFEESRSKIKTIQNQYDILPVQDKNVMTIVTGSMNLLSILRNDKFKVFANYKSAAR